MDLILKIKELNSNIDKIGHLVDDLIDNLDGKRKKRIALGSGNSIQEVNQLLKQFNQMKKMMKIMKKSGPSGMMSALGINE